MMLEHLGETPAAMAVITAVEKILAAPGLRTRDLGGSATTVECGTAIAEVDAG
jgi:tartrate dehydrogenase/decarboxylase/D-malate dehydrogenase